MKINKFLPYIGAIIVFIVASLLYFNPVLSGKQIKQSDITQFRGMSKEIVDYRKENGEEPYWLGNAFSGMPAYQVSTYFPNDFMKKIDSLLRFLPRPADYLFLYFLGFFVLLNALKVDWKLAILGSLSFGFSTYLIIIFGAGHNAKAHAIAYMPVVIAGVLYVFQKKYLIGFILASLGMALEIATNHIQMTYYLGFCLLILGIVELIEALKNKKISTFILKVGIILLAFILGLGANASRLMATKEYANYSTRGKSELTINPDGTPKEKTNGLDKSYITEYSYGVLETFNLLVPRYMGGGTVEKLSESSNFYKEIESKSGSQVAKEYSNQVLTYWGDQPIVEAPAYIGAIVIFLFFLGIFFVEGRLKYWLISATIFSIIMSWGRNFSFLTNLFIDYFPLYNKFRAVSSIQVIAELCIPVLGFLGLKEFLSDKIGVEEKVNGLKKAITFSGGLVVLGFLLAYMSSSFTGIRDGQYEQLPGLIDALISDRKSMLFYDSLRSMLLILLAAVALWLFISKKIKRDYTIVALAVLILFDLISVDSKYVNKEDFTSARKVQKPFTANKADLQILQDKSNYRVANFSVNPMNEGRTSYFHNSIGGYHAAKMMRYNELFEYQIAKNNLEILNMLNTKYFIVSDSQVQENKEANGNAWFVNKLLGVNSANEEIIALDSIKTKKEAVVRKDLFKGEVMNYEKDSLATITLKKNGTNYLVYNSNSTKGQFAVFSEIYYKNGWNAYIDGKLTPHYQVNYVLRGMPLEAGKHTIEFKFEPTVINKGSVISLICFVLMFLLPVAFFFFVRKNINLSL